MKTCITHKQLQDLLKRQVATFVCYTGLQKRSVYRVGNVFYEQAINFDDGKDHNHYWQISPNRAAEILEEILDESVRSR